MEALIDCVAGLPRLTRFGRVARMEGLLVEVTGAGGAIGLGGNAALNKILEGVAGKGNAR